MELCLLKFVAPFNLGLPTARMYAYQDNGKPITVITANGQGSLMFSYNRNNHKWAEEKLEEYPAFDPVTQQTDVVLKIKLGAVLDDFRGGLVDEIDYTVLSLIYENADDDLFNEVDKHVSWSKPIINRFLDNYRLATGRESYSGPIDPLQCRLVLAGRCRSGYTFNGTHISANFESGRALATVRHQALSGRGLTAPTDAELAAFADRLTNGITANTHESIMMEAAANSVRHQNYDVAIIHLETAFEVFVKMLLIEYCSKNRIPTLRNNRGERKGYRKAIAKGNIQEDLLRYIRTFSGLNVGRSAECVAWKNSTYTRRNKIVHEGFRGTTYLESVDAEKATCAFMAYLKNALP